MIKTLTNKSVALLVLLFTALTVQAQMLQPVKFQASLRTDGTAEADIVFTGTIEPGWHVYSTELGGDPISATFHANKLDGVELVGKLKPVGKELAKFDPIFEQRVRYFEGTARFVQRVRFTKPTYTIDAYLEYGACNDQNCLPPTQVPFSKRGKSPAAAQAKNETEAETHPSTNNATEAAALTTATDTTKSTNAVSETNTAANATTLAPVSAADHALWWKPVTQQLKQLGGMSAVSDQSLWYIFLMGVLGGLFAILMPCIWPIIPMTVSFFLKRAKDNKARGVRDAQIYGLSIVVIFVGLGMLVSALRGPQALNDYSTSAGFNLFLFALLGVFALSFFGWFELKVPDSWANAIDSKASQTTGLLAIFLMAFTLVVVSFSCTAPIMGLLLVQAFSSGDWVAPLVGMLGFSLALAVPFSVFALFPTLMKKSPRSGSWMNQIKVVLGFVELAFALKFFSVADLAYGWHLLDREVFLSLWIVIFAALGCYLVGWLKFRSDEIGGELQRPMPVPAIALGLCSFAFAVYMIPGLWGAPVKAVSAFAPPINTQDFRLGDHHVEAHFKDYEAGMQAARAQGKPVLIDFTGFGCVNCRKMEAAVWTDPRVMQRLEKDYVLISLYVDDKTPLPQPITVTRQGQPYTLRTVGDKWSYLQSEKFGANAQPYYVLLNNDGEPLAAPYAYKEDVPAYLDFLDKGLEAYRK